MFKYRYDYKYLNLKIKSLDIIVELAKDNTSGNTLYSAKTNIMFKDEYGDWGHAVGVGNNEQEALKMCLAEICEYLNYEMSPTIENLEMPTKIVFEWKKKTIVLHIEEYDNYFSVLTPKGRKNIITNNIVEYISSHPKEFINDSINNYSEQLFKMFNFSKPFDAMTKKNDDSETCNINSN